MNRKHSYRELARRRMARNVLFFVEHPDAELPESVSNENNRALKSAKQTALLMIKEFNAGRKVLLTQYSPCVNQIRKALQKQKDLKSRPELEPTGKVSFSPPTTFATAVFDGCYTDANKKDFPFALIWTDDPDAQTQTEILWDEGKPEDRDRVEDEIVDEFDRFRGAKE